jgi:hypothetical protein
MRHHGQANDLGAGFEVAKWRRFCHPQTLRNRPTLLKSVSSVTAARADLEPDDPTGLFSGHHYIQYNQIEGLSPSFRRHRMLCHRACKSVMFAYCSAHASQMEKR